MCNKSTDVLVYHSNWTGTQSTMLTSIIGSCASSVGVGCIRIVASTCTHMDCCAMLSFGAAVAPVALGSICLLTVDELKGAYELPKFLGVPHRSWCCSQWSEVWIWYMIPLPVSGAPLNFHAHLENAWCEVHFQTHLVNDLCAAGNSFGSPYILFSGTCRTISENIAATKHWWLQNNNPNLTPYFYI